MNDEITFFNRGKASPEVQRLTKRLFGYKITQKQLNLLYYMFCCFIKGENLKTNKVNKECFISLIRNYYPDFRLESFWGKETIRLYFGHNTYMKVCEVIMAAYCYDHISWVNDDWLKKYNKCEHNRRQKALEKLDLK